MKGVYYLVTYICSVHYVVLTAVTYNNHIINTFVILEIISKLNPDIVFKKPIKVIINGIAWTPDVHCEIITAVLDLHGYIYARFNQKRHFVPNNAPP